MNYSMEFASVGFLSHLDVQPVSDNILNITHLVNSLYFGPDHILCCKPIKNQVCPVVHICCSSSVVPLYFGHQTSIFLSLSIHTWLLCWGQKRQLPPCLGLLWMGKVKGARTINRGLRRLLEGRNLKAQTCKPRGSCQRKREKECLCFLWLSITLPETRWLKTIFMMSQFSQKFGPVSVRFCAQGCTRVHSFLERQSSFQAPSGCGRNLVPCGFTTEVPTSLLAVIRGCSDA